jgi:hypothetical protein
MVLSFPPPFGDFFEYAQACLDVVEFHGPERELENHAAGVQPHTLVLRVLVQLVEIVHRPRATHLQRRHGALHTLAPGFRQAALEVGIGHPPLCRSVADADGRGGLFDRRMRKQRRDEQVQLSRLFIAMPAGSCAICRHLAPSARAVPMKFL